MSTLYLYDESIDDYHANPSLSSSKLNDFVSRGPRYFAARNVTRTAKPPVQTEAMLLGQAFEDMLQRPAEWSKLYAVKPAGMKFTTKDGKAWRDAQTLPILSEEDVAMIREMVASVHENETAMALIHAAEPQVTMRRDWPGVPGLQSRPDWLSLEGCAESGFRRYTLDLKSTIALGKLTSGRGVIDYGYHQQAAISSVLMVGDVPAETAHYLLAVEKCQPHRPQVIEIPGDWIDAGWQWCQAALSKLARHYEANEWPRVEQEMIALPPCPAWVSGATSGDEGAA